MTIACVNLSDTALPLTDDEFIKYQEAYNVRVFATGIARAIVFNNNPDLLIPKNVLDAMHGIHDEYTLGRCGMRRITSAWVKEKHPNARYEIVYTIVSEDRNEVHVLLIYLP